MNRTKRRYGQKRGARAPLRFLSRGTLPLAGTLCAAALLILGSFANKDLLTAQASHDYALQFDGVDDLVTILDSDSLDFGEGDFSVETWVKVEAPQLFPAKEFIAKYNDDESQGWGTAIGGNDTTIFWTSDSDMEHYTQNYQDGKWHHLVGAREGQTILLYMDGAFIGSEIPTGSAHNVSSSSPLYMGGFPVFDAQFNGFIDDVRIYARSLQAAEVAEHYNGTYTNSAELRGWWKFNEGTGATLLDSSGFNNNGTIAGAQWVEGRTPHGVVVLGTGAPRNNVPDAKIQTNLSGIYNKVIPVGYSSADADDGIFGAPALGYGLRENSVTIFYSDDFWGEAARIVWQELAKDQPNFGTFSFDTSAIPDGTTYKLRVVAYDGKGESGEAVSGLFAIDNTGPTFDVYILTPLPIREKDSVQFRIVSSEELSKTPTMKIAQEGAEQQMLSVQGKGKEFFTSYEVIRGKGKAIIALQGEDASGNIGDVITSGKTFQVDQFGPATPVMDGLVDNQTFHTPGLLLAGTAEPGVEVVATLNGIHTFRATVGTDGRFTIEGIALSAANKGMNTLSIIAVNEKGEDSIELVYKLKLNSPPQVSLVQFPQGAVLGEQELIWDASDVNGDSLMFAVEYSNDGGVTWGTLEEEVSLNAFVFPTLFVADGVTIVRVRAFDGASTSYSDAKQFTVQNNMPQIILDAPAVLRFQERSLKLTGKTISDRRATLLVRYSLDSGATWQNAEPSDGAFGGLEETFAISFAELEEKDYTLLIEAQWGEGKYVRIVRSFSVDVTPPAPPVLESPALGTTIDPALDSDPDVEGVQLALRGKVEPGSRVSILINGREYRGIGVRVSKDGIFSVASATFLAHGRNEIELISTDLAGNESRASGIVITDTSPIVSSLSLLAGTYAHGIQDVLWQASDADGDSMTFDVVARGVGGERTLARDISLQNARVDFTPFASGNYTLVVIADDSFVQSEARTDMVIDNIRPFGQFTVVGEAFTNNARPLFRGTASDDFSGIESVEYSFEDKNWYQAILISGYQTTRAAFEFRHRFALEDAKYNVRVRASDQAGNSTMLGTQDVQIETTPPRVGSYTLHRGGILLFPEGNTFRVPQGEDLRFTISLEDDTQAAEIEVGGEVLALHKRQATALWEAEISAPTDSTDLVVHAQDLAQNSSRRIIGSLETIGRGRVLDEAGQAVEGAELDVSIWDGQGQAWRKWQAEAYDLSNPVQGSAGGFYSLLLPEGKYEINVRADGFSRLRSSPLELAVPRFITFDFVLKRLEGFGQFLQNIGEVIPF